jgi:hypothetical protein
MSASACIASNSTSLPKPKRSTVKIEELENLWAGQQLSLTPVPDLAEGRRKMLPELQRRGRFLGYSQFTLGFFLVVYPLLSVANFRHLAPPHPVLFWASVAAHLAFFATLFFWTIRQGKRYRVLARQSAGTIREVAELSLRNAEAEMREYQQNSWLLPAMFLLTLFGLAVNRPLGMGPEWLVLRLVGTLAFYAFGAGLFAFHYQANLKPAHARWSDIVRQLT